MAYSEAQKKAVKKYNEKAYDEIKVRVKKGYKDIIQKHAESKNETVNKMINRLLENEIPEINKWFTVIQKCIAVFFYSFYIVPSIIYTNIFIFY